MTIKNQCLTIPPDSPLAAELFDLIGIQADILSDHFTFSTTLANAPGAATALAIIEARFADNNVAIELVRNQYRRERGGDSSCTVGLTYGADRYPIVGARPRRKLN
jgi:hypothetical protein